MANTLMKTKATAYLIFIRDGLIPRTDTDIHSSTNNDTDSSILACGIYFTSVDSHF